jgi:hypothetical protein
MKTEIAAAREIEKRSGLEAVTIACYTESAPRSSQNTRGKNRRQ